MGDSTKDHDAWESDLSRFIKLDKGDFIGRDALVKAKEAGGPTRKTVQMEVDVGSDPVDCVGNESVRCAETGKVVGFTTSGVWGQMCQKSVALGYVYGTARWTDGYKLQVDLLGN